MEHPYPRWRMLRPCTPAFSLQPTMALPFPSLSSPDLDLLFSKRQTWTFANALWARTASLCPPRQSPLLRPLARSPPLVLGIRSTTLLRHGLRHLFGFSHLLLPLAVALYHMPRTVYLNNFARPPHLVKDPYLHPPPALHLRVRASLR
jgi:hypothetical protein